MNIHHTDPTGMATGAPRHFIDIRDVSTADLRTMLDLSMAIKANRAAVRAARPLDGRVLALIFEKPSTRTRVSFDVGMRELGGETLNLTGGEMQLGRGESIADTARVMSRFVDGIMIRTLDHDMVAELARHATIPVINGLTHRSHPCQIMADIQTFEEHKGPISGRTVAWIGPHNNMLRSWLEAAARLSFTMHVAAPEEFAPDAETVDAARRDGATVVISEDPVDGVRGADCIVTDAWVSMGDEDAAERHRVLAPYQVNEGLMANAPDAVFMHCLPAHRGEEVTDAVIDGPQSVVFDEAENRLHAQKAILAWCFGPAVMADIEAQVSAGG